MREVIVSIWSQPFQPNTPTEHHATIVARLYYAGNKVVKVETDSLHPYAGFAMSDLLRQLLGKTATRDSYETKVPRSIVEQHRIDTAQNSVEQGEFVFRFTPDPNELRLEVGKHYRRRDGRVVGPTLDKSPPGWNEMKPSHPFGVLVDRKFYTYKPNGRWGNRNDDESHLDLLEAATPSSSVAVPVSAPLQEKTSALSTQEGGNHYKGLTIQPVEFIHKNGIGYMEGNAIKYLTRWRDKGGIEDLRKARHYIDLLIEMEGAKP